MVSGSCLCGKIQYEVELIPEKTFNCHCSYCRKAHGAAFATMSFAKGETLKITKGKSLLSEHWNGSRAYRAFCSNCGTRLMNYTEDKSIYLSIALSTVDTSIDFKPVAHVNLESKACWFEPDEDIPGFESLPDNII